MHERAADAPSLTEILELTRRLLTESQPDDCIHECGRPALQILQDNPRMCMRLAYQKLHDVPYIEVKTCWRRLYTDAVLWKMLKVLEGRTSTFPEKKDAMNGVRNGVERIGRAEEEVDWITEVVKSLDMALILAGAPQREEVVELVFSALQSHIAKQEEAGEQQVKRRKLNSAHKQNVQHQRIPERFPDTIASRPELRCPIPRVKEPSFEAFETRISSPKTYVPIIITGAIDHWPALDERPWSRPAYLMGHTLGGRRLVPVEVGRSYTDQGWGQKILSFGDFMEGYMFRGAEELLGPVDPQSASFNGQEHRESEKETRTLQIGYLAQHDLFAQIPSLRSDISIPDYCYSSPPSRCPSNVKPVAKLEDPLLNAWFGPANTISPLHTDPYHNILAQVVGYKYVRLYSPGESVRLHPRGTDEMGVDMSNTSSVDLDEFFAAYPNRSPFPPIHAKQDGDDFDSRFPGFKDAEYVEGVLGPGECLNIPVGWWHYVRSLTPSFSVSFWFN